MIKSIIITNFLKESIQIFMTEEEPEHGLIIKSIEGLGPPKASINMTKIATNDGSVFNSARLEERNIIIQFLFGLSPTIEDSRQRTYKFFPIKKELEFLIETDNRVVKATGYVESNDPDVFSKKESNQISIICDDPYFYSAGLKEITTTLFYGTEPLFEFEFENDSIDEKEIEFGSVEYENERTIFYEGDSEIGITITIHALGEVRNLIIYNTGTREHMKIDTTKLAALTGSGIINGDDIIISSVRGNKTIQLLRAGRYYNILNCLEKGSDWFTLVKGDNIFAFTAEYGGTNLQFKIENRTIYEGV